MQRQKLYLAPGRSAMSKTRPINNYIAGPYKPPVQVQHPHFKEDESERGIKVEKTIT